MDQEEAPPPYSAVDPLLDNRNGNASQATNAFRANDTTPQNGSSSHIAAHGTASSSTVVPTHFASAAAYFEQRPPTMIDESRALLQHHMTIYPRSQSKDFPRRPRCWASRREEITQQDWDMFLRYLFPPQLGLAATSQHLPRQLRAEIQRDRKDRPQETDEERRARITTVIDEWNRCFFELRATRIVFIYIGEPYVAPASALCPRCYPAATKATQGVGNQSSMDGQSARTSNAPSPVPGQHNPSPNSWPISPYPTFANSHPQPMGFTYPWGVPTAPPPPGTLPNHQPPQYNPPPPPPPPGVPTWQWNNWAYAQPQFGNSGSSKGGALGWISHLTSQAQKYGERFAEQAQQYGDQISAHAMHYGRQVEEQALAHGRWIEEQARLRGRKPGAYPTAPYSPHVWTPPPINSQSTGVMQTAPMTTEPVVEGAQLQSQLSTQGPIQGPGVERDKELPTERSRRSSITSVSSDSSLSSIESLSTSSNLSVSDLANVRSQLQSLNDRHDRTLHEAAVDLRRQLDVLQASRREARMYSRRGWRNGWDRHHQLHHHEHHSRSHHRPDRDDWGRWESPEQQQRQSAQRLAMKEEMRATRKAFKDVVQRARDEQRNKIVQQNPQRHEPPRHSGSESHDEDETLLDGRLKYLAVVDPSSNNPTITQTESPKQALEHPTGHVPAKHEASSTCSAPSAVSPSASMHKIPSGSSDRKNRLRKLLKPRNTKKQQQQRREAQSRNDTEVAPGEDVAEVAQRYSEKRG